MLRQKRNYDLRKLLKPYTDKWVALSPDYKKVVAKGNNLKDTASKVTSEDVVFLKVFPSKSFYMPKSHEV